MAKVRLVKWTSNDGQTAISFPTQGLLLEASPIVRRARDAAEYAVAMLVRHWDNTVSARIPEPVYILRNSYRDRARRRYTKLFKAMGLK